MAELLPAARQARDALVAQGQPLTRPALTEHLRATGHPVSNARASVLVKVLRSDSDYRANGRSPATSVVLS